MLTLFLAAVLSQTPAAVAPPVTAPVAGTTTAQTGAADSAAALNADMAAAEAAEKKVARNCVTKTGTRIQRKDRDNCINGKSISQDDIDRAGGQFIAPTNTAVPISAGH